MGDKAPQTGQDWCEEAIASQQWRDAAGDYYVECERRAAYPKDPLIAAIDKLSSAHWWRQGHSVRLCKRTVDYLQHLQLVLSHANSIQIIDPFIDPTQRHYQELWEAVRRHPTA